MIKNKRVLSLVTIIVLSMIFTCTFLGKSIKTKASESIPNRTFVGIFDGITSTYNSNTDIVEDCYYTVLSFTGGDMSDNIEDIRDVDLINSKYHTVGESFKLDGLSFKDIDFDSRYSNISIDYRNGGSTISISIPKALLDSEIDGYHTLTIDEGAIFFDGILPKVNLYFVNSKWTYSILNEPNTKLTEVCPLGYKNIEIEGDGKYRNLLLFDNNLDLGNGIASFYNYAETENTTSTSVLFNGKTFYELYQGNNKYEISYSEGLSYFLFVIPKSEFVASNGYEVPTIEIMNGTPFMMSNLPEIKLIYTNDNWIRTDYVADFVEVNKDYNNSNGYSIIKFDTTAFTNNGIPNYSGILYNGESVSELCKTGQVTMYGNDSVFLKYQSNTTMLKEFYNGYSHPTLEFTNGSYYMINSVKVYFEPITLYMVNDKWTTIKPNNYGIGEGLLEYKNVIFNNGLKEFTVEFSGNSFKNEDISNFLSNILFDDEVTLDDDGGSIVLMDGNKIVFNLNNDYKKISVRKSICGGIIVEAFKFHHIDNKYYINGINGNDEIVEFDGFGYNNLTIGENILFDLHFTTEKMDKDSYPKEVSEGFTINGLSLTTGYKTINGFDFISNGIGIRFQTTEANLNDIVLNSINGYNYPTVHIDFMSYFINLDGSKTYFEETTLYCVDSKWTTVKPSDYCITKQNAELFKVKNIELNNDNLKVELSFYLNDFGSFDEYLLSTLIDNLYIDEVNKLVDVEDFSYGYENNTITLIVPKNLESKYIELKEESSFNGYIVSPFKINHRVNYYLESIIMPEFEKIEWDNLEVDYLNNQEFHNYNSHEYQNGIGIPDDGKLVLIKFDKALSYDSKNNTNLVSTIGNKVYYNDVKLSEISGSIIDYSMGESYLFIYIPILGEGHLHIDNGLELFDSVLSELDLYFYNISSASGNWHLKRLLTVSFDTNGGNDVNDIRVVEGDSLVLPNSPLKESNESTDFTFKYWYLENENTEFDINTKIIENITLNAKWNESVRKYVIRFVNDIDVLESKEVEYGTLPEYKGSEPVKETDVLYSYTFNGWDKDISIVTGNETYKACFKNIYNEYSIVFICNGVIISENKYHYGDEIVVPQEGLEKQSDSVYRYEFLSWNREITICDGAKSYTAVYEPFYIEYTVKFMNGDTEFMTSTYHYDDEVIMPVETPTKEQTVDKIYSFSNWDKEIGPVKGNTVYYAVYNEVLRKYTITFKNGDTVLESKEIEYGVTPEYNGDIPIKNADNTYMYEFVSWDSELSPVKGDIIYNAVFSNNYIEYTIRFMNETNLISSESYHYGDTVNIPSNVIKESSEELVYTFTGWNREIETVTKDATYYALFDESIRYYTISFVVVGASFTLNPVLVTYDTKMSVNSLGINKEGYDRKVILNDIEITEVTVKSDIELTVIYTKNKGCKGLISSSLMMSVMLIVSIFNLRVKKKREE